MTKKVFISYAHESDTLSENVFTFSNYLRSEGIDSEIDQYEEAPSEGWPKWMLRQIQDADYVLIVCSSLFYERANDTTSSTDGLGVKWETNLILQQLYSMSVQNEKFIPIIFNSSDKKFIPLPLEPYTHYKISDEQEKLKNRILGISRSTRPKLGKVAEPEQEPLNEKTRKSMFISSIIDLELWDKAMWNGIAFLTDPSLQQPPIIGFMFTNNKYGDKIFSNLKTRFGETDTKEEIRISLINEISDENPQYYNVHFGTDRDVIIDKFKENGLEPVDTFFMSVSRINEMQPKKGSTNLDVFKHSYSYFKKYAITNIIMKDGKPTANYGNLIEKTKINFRKKSDIIHNQHDEDIVVFKKTNT